MLRFDFGLRAGDRGWPRYLIIITCVELRWKYAAMAALLQSQSVLNINLQGIMALLLRPGLTEKLGKHFYTSSSKGMSWISLTAAYISILLFQYDK